MITVILVSAIFGLAPNITIPLYALMLIGLVSLSVLATVVVVFIIYPRLTFWVTNKRIINGSGVIKYVIRSIPIEVITDIVLQRGFTDFLFGTNEIFLPTIDDKTYQLYPNNERVNHIPSVDAPMTKALQTALADIRAKRMAKRTEMSQVSP